MTKTLEEIVSTVVKERIDSVDVHSVTVTPQEDTDGDPILVVTVVLSSDLSKFESRKLLGLARHVRSKIVEQSESAFPIFRFMSKSDSERLRHAAA
jgi:hypothetical protein